MNYYSKLLKVLWKHTRLLLILDNIAVVKGPPSEAAAAGSRAWVTLLPWGRNLSHVLFFQVPSDVAVV